MLTLCPNLSQHAKIFIFPFTFGFEGLETISPEHLRKLSETFGRLREIFGSGCYVFGNPGHDETKISRI